MALDPILDAEVIKEKKDEIRKRLKDRRKSDLRKVLQLTEGRRFLWWVLGEAGVLKVPYTGIRNSTDYNCGKLEVGLSIFNRIPPETYAVMQREAASDKLIQESELKSVEEENG